MVLPWDPLSRPICISSEHMTEHNFMTRVKVNNNTHLRADEEGQGPYTVVQTEVTRGPRVVKTMYPIPESDKSPELRKLYFAA